MSATQHNTQSLVSAVRGKKETEDMYTKKEEINGSYFQITVFSA